MCADMDIMNNVHSRMKYNDMENEDPGSVGNDRNSDVVVDLHTPRAPTAPSEIHRNKRRRVTLTSIYQTVFVVVYISVVISLPFILLTIYLTKGFENQTVSNHTISKREIGYGDDFVVKLKDALTNPCKINTDSEECLNELINIYTQQMKVWENITKSYPTKERARINNAEDGRLQLPVTSETMKAASQVFHNPAQPSSGMPPNNIPPNCFPPEQLMLPSPQTNPNYQFPIAYPMMMMYPPPQMRQNFPYSPYNMQGAQNNIGWWPMAYGGQPFICMKYPGFPGTAPDFRNAQNEQPEETIETDINDNIHIETSNQQTFEDEPWVKIEKLDERPIANKTYGHTKHMADARSVGDCEPDEHLCISGECITESKWCDGIVDCKDASDETSCPCRSRIDPSRVCDGFFDCPLGEEELGCLNCDEFSFSCNDYSQVTKESGCFKLNEKCDGIKKCRNGLDERECTMLHETLNNHTVFEVTNSKGFLHKNYKGKWYPLCGTPIKLVNEACAIENGSPESVPTLQFVRKPKDFVGKFMIWKENIDRIQFVDDCEDEFVLFVICPQPKCGSKTRVSQFLRESNFQSDLYDRAARRKRNIEYTLEVDDNFELVDPIFYELDDSYAVENIDINEEHQIPIVPLQLIFPNDMSDELANEKVFTDYYPNPIYPAVPNHPEYLHIPENDFLRREFEMEPQEQYTNPKVSMRSRDSEFAPSNSVPMIEKPNIMLHETNPVVHKSRKNESSSQIQSDSKNRTENISSKNNETQTSETDESDPIVGIVGGKFSGPAEWPWLVGIFKNGLFNCGGSIISDKWVLTAGHCTIMYWKHYYEVSAGMLRRFSYSPQEQVSPVEQVVMHEMFDRATMHNDLSLLKLKRSLAINKWTRPVCLPSEKVAGPSWLWGPPAGIKCTVIGWGAIKENQANPDHLREVEVPIISSCKSKDDEEGKEICAGFEEGGKDACQGDSGGPFLCRNPSDPNQWFVAGIVSHGEGCARPGVPGAYTRVSLYTHWIKEAMRGEHSIIRTPKQSCPGFTCIWGVKRCIPKSKVCDKIVDCLGGEDEFQCDSESEIFRSKKDDDIFDDELMDTLFPNYTPHSTHQMKKSTTTKPPAGRSAEVEDSDVLLSFSDRTTVLKKSASSSLNRENELVEQSEEIIDSEASPSNILVNTTIVNSNNSSNFKNVSMVDNLGNSTFSNNTEMIKLNKENNSTLEINKSLNITLNNTSPIQSGNNRTNLTSTFDKIQNQSLNINDLQDNFINIPESSNISLNNMTEKLDMQPIPQNNNLNDPNLDDGIDTNSESDLDDFNQEAEGKGLGSLTNDFNQTSEDTKDLNEDFEENNSGDHDDNEENDTNDKENNNSEDKLHEPEINNEPLDPQNSNNETNLTDDSKNFNTDNATENSFENPIEDNTDKKLSNVDNDFEDASETDQNQLNNDFEETDTDEDGSAPEPKIDIDDHNTPTENADDNENNSSNFLSNSTTNLPDIENKNLPLNSFSENLDDDDNDGNKSPNFLSANTTNRPDIEDKNLPLNSLSGNLDVIESKDNHFDIDLSMFRCRGFNQSISRQKRCDFEVDCEDGTDEFNCTCRERMVAQWSTGICDNYPDCQDGTDEIDCGFCPTGYLYCNHSKQCVPPSKVCDRKRDCEFGEDELNCFALKPTNEFLMEKDFKPSHSSEGELIMFNNGQWEEICETEWNNNKKAASAVHICNYLGFGLAKDYSLVPNDSGCSKLFVTCDSSNSQFSNLSITSDVISYDQQSLNINRLDLLPWMVKLHTNGQFMCTGVLISYSWILVEEACADVLLSSDTNIIATVGSRRRVSGIYGLYEQHNTVDNIYPVSLFPLKMLHVKSPFKPSKYVMSVKLPPMDHENYIDDEICTINSIDNEGLPANIHLIPVMENCPYDRCFKRPTYSDCQDIIPPLDQCKWSGIIVCYRKNYGWYAASTYREPKGPCGFTNVQTYPNIYNRRNEIDINLTKEINLYDNSKPTQCNYGVQCPLGECIPMERVCDGIPDCFNAVDEQEINCRDKRNYCNQNPNSIGCGCNRLQLHCRNGRCVNKESFGNGIDDCNDNSDEQFLQEGPTPCFSYLKMTNPSYICDGVSHCEDRSDEDYQICGCSNSYESFTCETEDGYSKCIPTDAVCDGKIDCARGEDEHTCEAIRPIYGLPGIGEVIELNHGFWQPKCFPKDSFTKTELENICSSLGYSNGHAVLINPSEVTNYDAAPLTFISLDHFSTISINNMTFGMRNRDKPYAMKLPITDQICHRIFIECV